MRDPTSLRLWSARLLTALLLSVTLWALWATTATSATDQRGSPDPAAVSDRQESVYPASHPETELSPAAASLVASLYILILAGFVGFEVIGGVSPLLHTPLMSVTNAISSVIVVGALLAVGVPMISSGSGWARGFGFIALIFACVNIFGGFLVTQRMLAMYKKKAK